MTTVLRKFVLGNVVEVIRTGTLHKEKYGGMPLLTQFHSTYPIDGWSDGYAAQAYHGDMGKAHMLHKAVIDDYSFLVGINWAEVWLPHGSGDLYKFNSGNVIPARAWLITILMALQADE